MERFLPCVGFGALPSLAVEVKEQGRVVFQAPGLPPVRMLEAGSDLGVAGSDGAVWPVLSTRWRTDFALEHLAPIPGGHLIGVGLWEPVPGVAHRAALHVNTFSQSGVRRPLPLRCSSYLSLLATSVESSPGPPGARLTPAASGPTADVVQQCLLRVRAKVADTYTFPNDRTGEPVQILWLSSPGGWAIQVATALAGPFQRGGWVEAEGLLQGDLVVSDKL